MKKRIVATAAVSVLAIGLAYSATPEAPVKPAATPASSAAAPATSAAAAPASATPGPAATPAAAAPGTRGARGPAAPLTEEQLKAIEKEAHDAMDKFYEVFNKADNEELQKYMQFPHIVMTGTNISVNEERFDMNFDTMKSREGWAKSTLDSAKAVYVQPTKVTFDIVYSRHHADGTTYTTQRGIWIMTKKDGHWGLAVRSY